VVIMIPSVVVYFLIVISIYFYCQALSPRPASRRKALVAGFATPFILNLPSCHALEVVAAAGDELIVPRGKSVLVLGANGGTGKECVKAVLASGRQCIATSRSGVLDYGLESSSENLKVMNADVTSSESLQNTVSSVGNLGAVIFAASASTKGGNAYKVDKDGVVKSAQFCIDNNINRFVLVSSGSVTRPDSAIYKLLNTVGKGIMEAKIQGEDAMRDLYTNPQVLNKRLGYTVIRPGGLTMDEAAPTSTILELNQGDSKSGRLSRSNVAALCVNCLDSPSAWDSTFECYEKLTAKPINAVGFSNILKSKDPTVFKSGKERQGETWNSIFLGLERDVGHNA